MDMQMVNVYMKIINVKKQMIHINIGMINQVQ